MGAGLELNHFNGWSLHLDGLAVPVSLVDFFQMLRFTIKDCDVFNKDVWKPVKAEGRVGNLIY